MTRDCYHRAINAAQLAGFIHLADVLLMLYAYDYPGEVPEKVLSLRGTRPSERSGALWFTADLSTDRVNDWIKESLPSVTVPAAPLGG